MKTGEVWKVKKLIADNQQGYYKLCDYFGNDRWSAIVWFEKIKDSGRKEGETMENTTPFITQVTGEFIYGECIRCDLENT